MFVIGNDPQDDEENILFNGDGTVGGPALTVTGLTKDSDLFVSFTGTENLVSPSNGAARVEAADGAFTSLSIEVVDGTFHDFIFNINQNQSTGLGGTAHFVVDLVDEPDVTFDFLLSSNNGSNFLTVLAINGERIENISFTSSADVAFLDLRQPRISGATANADPDPQPDPVPEPATLALLGIAAAGLGFARRRKLN
jgi:hypothetical protein